MGCNREGSGVCENFEIPVSTVENQRSGARSGNGIIHGHRTRTGKARKAEMTNPPVLTEAPGLRQATLLPEYDTEENDIVAELYAPCLRLSESYDRAVGYFRA